jgi:hypothetical protein
MHTYRIERLAADLAEVLTALQVSGPPPWQDTRWAG